MLCITIWLACNAPGYSDTRDTALVGPEELYGLLLLQGAASSGSGAIRPTMWFERGTLPTTEAGECYNYSASTYDEYFYVDRGEVTITLDGEAAPSELPEWPVGQRLSAMGSGALFPAFDLGPGIQVPPWFEFIDAPNRVAAGQTIDLDWPPTDHGWVVVHVYKWTDPEATDMYTCIFDASIGAAEVLVEYNSSSWSVYHLTETLIPVSPTQGILVQTASGTHSGGT